MIHEEKCNAMADIVQMVLEDGLEGLGPAVSVLLNEAMRVERNRALAAEPWERTPERKGHANGYKPRTLKTRLGKLDLQVPQVRGDVEFLSVGPGTRAAQRTGPEGGPGRDVRRGRFHA